MGSDKLITRYAYNKAFTVRFPDRYEWKDSLMTNRKGRLIWYTDGSKTSIGTGAGVYGYATKPRLKFLIWTVNYSFVGVYGLKMDKQGEAH
jgi:hypothetical protein